MTPLEAGPIWQQILALGLVAAFVGAVRVLDRFYLLSAAGAERVEQPTSRSDSDPMQGSWGRGTRRVE